MYVTKLAERCSVGSAADGPLLTDEDRTLLERWKSIYPRSSHSVSSDDSQSTLSVTDSVERHISDTQSSNSSSVLLNNNEPCSLPGRGVNGSLLPGHMAPPLWLGGVSAVQTDCSATCQLSVLPSLIPSAVAPSYLPPAEMQSSFAALLAETNNNTQPAIRRSPELLTSLNLSRCGEKGDFNEMTGNTLPSSYHPMLETRTLSLGPVFQDASQAVVEVGFLHGNHSSKIAPVPVAWTIYGSTDRAGEGNVGDLTCVEVVGNGSSGVSSRTNESSSFVDDAGSTSDDLRVITSRLMKSHVEDLMLHHTPRGTGAGYGVGVDVSTDLPSSGSHAGQEGSVLSSFH